MPESTSTQRPKKTRWILIPFNQKLALVWIIPYQIHFSLISDKDKKILTAASDEKHSAPPPPNTIKTANEGRFRLNVDYGERAQSTVHARPSGAPGTAAGNFIFNLSMRESKAWQTPRPVVVCLHHAGGRRRFDSVSAHLLATAANIFGWAGDPTK